MIFIIIKISDLVSCYQIGIFYSHIDQDITLSHFYVFSLKYQPMLCIPLFVWPCPIILYVKDMALNVILSFFFNPFSSQLLICVVVLEHYIDHINLIFDPNTYYFPILHESSFIHIIVTTHQCYKTCSLFPSCQTHTLLLKYKTITHKKIHPKLIFLGFVYRKYYSCLWILLYKRTRLFRILEYYTSLHANLFPLIFNSPQIPSNYCEDCTKTRKWIPSCWQNAGDKEVVRRAMGCQGVSKVWRSQSPTWDLSMNKASRQATLDYIYIIHNS